MSLLILGAAEQWGHWSLSFGLQLVSLSVFLKFVHIVARSETLFLFAAKLYSIIQIYHVLLICFSVGRRLGGFHVLAVENNATVNVGAQVSVQVPVFNSFGDIYLSARFLIQSHVRDIVHPYFWWCARAGYYSSQEPIVSNSFQVHVR